MATSEPRDSAKLKNSLLAGNLGVATASTRTASATTALHLWENDRRSRRTRDIFRVLSLILTGFAHRHALAADRPIRSSFASRALLVVQATLSVVLVAGATMLARSLNKLEHQDFGYQVQGRVVVSLHNPPATYTQPKLAALYRQLEERLNRLPGVRGSGLALYNPLTDNWGELIYVSGHPRS